MNDAEQRRANIDRIARFPDELEAAVSGLSAAALDHRPAGEWSVRQNVHHLADSHSSAYFRLKLALTEDHPTIRPYDQDAFAELPDTSTAPLELSLTLLRGLHQRWAYLLRALDDAAWARTYVHPDSGQHTVDDLLKSYAAHCDAHLDQISRALADYAASQR